MANKGDAFSADCITYGAWPIQVLTVAMTTAVVFQNFQETRYAKNGKRNINHVGQMQREIHFPISICKIKQNNPANLLSTRMK